jgi:hypothetical protein
MPRVSLALPARIRDELWAHLFPGDGDEHGAVLMVGMARSDRGLRLLAREAILAQDGIDYVEGRRGYRRLMAKFIHDAILRCRDEGFGYLAVHNHGGDTTVGFSDDDFASHERGYPALLDILGEVQPVGALVVARSAVAGDIWFASDDRRELTETRVIGANLERLYPSPPPRPASRDERYDRQARLFGDRGQALLADTKVGVIGAGGIGSLVIEQLARLGVGHLVVVDPDRIEVSNLSRVVGSSGWNARAWATRDEAPAWLRRLGATLATPKATIAHRLAHRANPRGRFEAIVGDVSESEVASRLIDCDYLFLAADGAQPRLVFNAIVHQYLIPGVQLGAKILVDEDTGDILDAFSVVRPVSPDHGCLWCNGLISPARLAAEAATPIERRRQNYMNEPEVPAPSVITMNAVSASHGADNFLYALTELELPGTEPDYLRFIPRSRSAEVLGTRSDAACPECGTRPDSRRATGGGRRLPVRGA